MTWQRLEQVEQKDKKRNPTKNTHTHMSSRLWEQRDGTEGRLSPQTGPDTGEMQTLNNSVWEETHR